MQHGRSSSHTCQRRSRAAGRAARAWPVTTSAARKVATVKTESYTFLAYVLFCVEVLEFGFSRDLAGWAWEPSMCIRALMLLFLLVLPLGAAVQNVSSETVPLDQRDREV